MKLSSTHKVDPKMELINDLTGALARALNNKVLSEDQVKTATDLLAMAKNINAMKDKEQIKLSGTRFIEMYKSARFSEDQVSSDVRKERKEHVLDQVKEITPRSLGENKTVEFKFRETISDNYAKKTTSSTDPSLVMERILTGISEYHYGDVQAAYDGWCNDGGAYLYASAQQKVRVGELLKFHGVAVDYSKWTKEAEKDRKEYEEKMKDYGFKHTAAKDEDPLGYKKPVTDNRYCAQCASTTKHSVSTSEGGKNYTCIPCGTERKKVNNIKREGQIMPQTFDFDFGDGASKIEMVATGLKVKYMNDKTPVKESDINIALPDDMKNNSLAIQSVMDKLESEMGVFVERNAQMDTRYSPSESSIWQPSPSEPGWQKNRIGKEYQVVFDPQSGSRGFIGRDDIVYRDQELTTMFDYSQDLKRPMNAQLGNQRQQEGAPESNQINMKPQMEALGGFGYVCGDKMCGQGEMKQVHGDYDCAKCGKKMVYSNEMQGFGGAVSNAPSAGGTMPNAQQNNAVGPMSSGSGMPSILSRFLIKSEKKITIRKNEHGEHVVRVTENGKVIDDYHTDDKADAEGTAADMAKRHGIP